MKAWKTVALGDVAAIEREVVEASAVHDGTLYIGLENISSGGVLVGVREVTNGELASSKFAFTPRHLLYGKLRPYLAKIARPQVTGICSTDILPVLPGKGLDRDYLANFLLRPESIAQAASRATGANLPRLSPHSLAEIRVPLPPLSEQQRIAEVLDWADALRAKRRAALAQLDSLAQAIFSELSWQIGHRGFPTRTLGEAVELVTVGHVGPTSRFFCDDGVPFLRTGNIGASGIVRSDLKHITQEFHARLKKSTLRAGDVLVSRVISDEVRCAIVPAEFDGANCANVIVIRPGPRMVSQYLVCLIRSPQSQRSFLQRQVGSAQAVVNTGVLQSWKIIVPPLSLQEGFASRVEAIERLKSAHRASLVQLDALFASLQYRAFRGEL